MRRRHTWCSGQAQGVVSESTSRQVIKLPRQLPVHRDLHGVLNAGELSPQTTHINMQTPTCGAPPPAAAAAAAPPIGMSCGLMDVATMPTPLAATTTASVTTAVVFSCSACTYIANTRGRQQEHTQGHNVGWQLTTWHDSQTTPLHSCPLPTPQPTPHL